MAKIAILQGWTAILQVWTAGAIWLIGTTALWAQPRLDFDRLREQMVAQEIEAAGIRDARVVEAMRKTPRHEFVPLNLRDQAYLDMALPIGDRQTISPPFVVAYMTESLEPQAGDRVLEIGTGSGFQAAVLSPLVAEVYSIEIEPELGRRAARVLKRLKYENVFTQVGDGYLGWPEKAPFDKIIVTCSPENVPQPLVDQLKDGGLLIVPLGERYKQTLYRFRKRGSELEREALLPTLFVPMTGAAEERRNIQPDPARPAIYNGSFEELFDPPRPEPLIGWHYQRQLSVATDGARNGERYVTFTNTRPGQGAQCLQGMALDGRRVAAIRLSAWVRLKNVRPGQSPQQLPVVALTFYDEGRGTVLDDGLGPWQGTRDWERFTRTLKVPLRTREAIVRVGLLGAVGEMSVDDVTLEAVETREAK